MHSAIRAGTRLSACTSLALLTGGLLAGLWVSIAIFLQIVHEQSLVEGRKDLDKLAQLYAEEVRSSAHAIDLTLMDLRERWLEEPQKFLERVRSRQSRLAKDVAFQVAIIDANGFLAFSSADAQAKGVNLRDREHFQVHARQSGDLLFVSEPVLGRVSGRWSIQFTRPLRQSGGDFAGVIVLSVSPAYFTRFAGTIDPDTGGRVTLLRTGRDTLAGTPFPAPDAGTTSSPPAVPDMLKKETGLFEQVAADGQHLHYSWRSLPNYGLTVLIARPRDRLLAAYIQQRKITIWAGVGVSLLFVVIGYLASHAMRQQQATRIALEQSENRLQYALEGAGEGVWDCNIETGEVYYSRRWKAMLGYSDDDIGNTPGNWERLLHEEDKMQTLASLNNLMSGREELYAVEFRLRCKDGTWKWIYSRGMAILRDASGRALRVVGTHADISERKRNEEAERHYQSTHDALTGLANRQLMIDRTGRAIAFAQEQGEQLWVISVNLDRFKYVNETQGYEAGDLLLQMVARRLQAMLRPMDAAGRLAGNDFVLLIPNPLDEHALITTVQHVMDAVACPVMINDHEYFLSCTVGVAAYPTDGQDAETLFRHADIAMHRGKELGRNNFQFFTSAMNERAMDRLRLESDLRYALQRQELLLHYQPQVDLRSGRIVGMEVLLRWQHPQLGLVPPDRFIRIAEETGVIKPIGAWVLHSACVQAAQWHDAGLGPLQISINLSGSQFYQPDLVDAIEAVLRDTGLPANCLDVELTEGLVMHDVELALEIMNRLKRLGVRLSLDDFGTGYSSLSYLKRFPIDVLKIDKSFVRNITTDPSEAAIARSIITLARSLQLQVVAEGVETESQLSYLRRHRCDQVQGFYFSRPIPDFEAEQLLREDRRLALGPTGEHAHRQTLLIVDDEENVASALYRLLRRDGYRILRARTPAEGLEQLALHEVQVVLSDQRMPDMSGTVFLSLVKDLYPDTIRIMLSGYTAVDTIVEAINSGAVFRFHVKPWDDEALRTTIAEAFRYHWMVHQADALQTATTKVETWAADSMS